MVSVGDKAEVMVLDIDEDRRRISLGIKQCRANPWDEFATTHADGHAVRGRIKSITDFGIFVGLSGGIDGLVYLSDISWNEPGETAVRRYSKGEEIDTVILSIDPDRERISLGIKQLDQDPFTDYIEQNARNSIVDGEVISVDAKEAVVRLAPDVDGRLKASEIDVDRVADARTALSVGTDVTVKIIGIDRRKPGHQLVHQGRANKTTRSKRTESTDIRRPPSAPGPTTLGDLIKEQMRAQQQLEPTPVEWLARDARKRHKRHKVETHERLDGCAHLLGLSGARGP